jgi:hypothetical protein
MSTPPRIFVSSTIEDLAGVRKKIGSFLKSLGYMPLIWEKWSIAHDQAQKGTSGGVIDSAIREVRRADMMILVLGKVYGFVPKGGVKSVTELEYDAARKGRLPVYAFVEKQTLDEYKSNFSRNQAVQGVNYATDLRVHQFIGKIYRETSKSPLIFPFDTIADITQCLKMQWASLFGEYLREKRSESASTVSAQALVEDEEEDLDLPVAVHGELRSNKLVQFSLDMLRSRGLVVGLIDILDCLRSAHDLQSYCMEVHRRFGCDMIIDRMLVHRAESEYGNAKELIGPHIGGLDILQP